MKKIFTAIFMIAMLTILIPAAASAQRRGNYREYDYYGESYDRNRGGKTALKIAGAAGVGAIIGALIGGKKGALMLEPVLG